MLAVDGNGFHVLSPPDVVRSHHHLFFFFFFFFTVFSLVDGTDAPALECDRRRPWSRTRSTRSPTGRRRKPSSVWSSVRS
jgi:hypothetical protein